MPLSIVLFTGLSTIFSIAALIFSYRALRVRRFAPSKFHSLDLKLADLEFQLEQLRTSHKRLNSRVAMRQAREKKDSAPEPPEEVEELPVAMHPSTSPTRQDGESDLDWKRRVRTLIATGELKHGR